MRRGGSGCCSRMDMQVVNARKIHECDFVLRFGVDDIPHVDWA